MLAVFCCITPRLYRPFRLFERWLKTEPTFPRLAEVVLDTQRGSRPQGDLPRASATGPGCGGRPIDLWKKMGGIHWSIAIFMVKLAKGIHWCFCCLNLFFNKTIVWFLKCWFNNCGKYGIPMDPKHCLRRYLTLQIILQHFLRRYGWIHTCRVCPDVFDVSILKGKGWPQRQDLGVFVA